MRVESQYRAFRKYRVAIKMAAHESTRDTAAVKAAGYAIGNPEQMDLMRKSFPDDLLGQYSVLIFGMEFTAVRLPCMR
jgi:hypothetical protein